MKYLLEYKGRAAFVEMLRDDTSDYYGAVQKAFQAVAGGRADSCAFVAMIRADSPETVCGVPYTWGLAGPDGGWFELLAMPEITPAQIAQAKAKLRRDQDVVTLTVRRITELIAFTQPPRTNP